jgi:DNA-binding NarL/FixJ family response regulator
MLAEATDMRLCGEAASGEEALKSMPILKPDLVLMDVHMPGMDGPLTTRTLLAQYPGTKVIAWTVSEASDDLLRMMQAGCSGYILKDVGPSELQHALLAAARNESPVPRKMIPDVLRRVAAQSSLAQPSGITLTSREMQVLRGLARGWTTKRIAREVGLAIPTVETYLGNLYRKLGAGNRGEAVSAALRANLISLADV